LADLGSFVGHKIIVRCVIPCLQHRSEEPLAVNQSEESHLLPGLHLQQELSNIEAALSSPSLSKDIAVAKSPVTAPSGCPYTISTSYREPMLPSDYMYGADSKQLTFAAVLCPFSARKH